MIYKYSISWFIACMNQFVTSVRAFSILAVLCILSVLVLSTAVSANASVSTAFKGWGYAANPLGGAVPAWSWNAGTQQWQYRTVVSNTQMYMWPWTADWEWTWTAASGWLAIRQSYVFNNTTNGRRLLWSDEFNSAAGTPPNSGNWSIQTGDYGYGGLACFTNDNVYHMGDGSLILRARIGASCGGRAYSAASIDGKQQFGPPAAGQTISYEGRIKGPCGSGQWPGFWAVGTEREWPLDGEIDMIELFGNNPLAASQTIHGPTTTGGHWQQPRDVNASTPWCNAYHVYGANWSQNEIEFTIDGKVTQSRPASSIPAGAVWPFNPYKENLRLTLALGDYAGAVDNTRMPSGMYVDWVRVYG